MKMIVVNFTLLVLLVLACERVECLRRQTIRNQLNTASQTDLKKSKSDIYAQTPEMIRKYGYPVESHVVTTDDGYILTLHRIPHGRNASKTGKLLPVLIMHGIFGASDIWVLNGPDKALGFIMADAGYDVWLGNARGNLYSRKHVSLKPSDPKFWRFSWHEMGNNDLPAVIDYMLASTASSQIFYIGHSMGNTMFFALMATQPAYNSKVRVMAALAPVTLNGRLRVTFKELFTPFSDNIIDGFYRSGQLEVLPRISANAQLAQSACRDGTLTQPFCTALYFSIFGVNYRQLNTTMLPMIWSHLLSGTSAATVNHFVENNKSGRFQRYDWTRRGRIMPLYDLTKITTPILLYYSDNDSLLHPKVVAQLISQLPNIAEVARFPDKKGGHYDFVFGIQVKSLVYDNMMHIMQKFH